MKPQSYLGFDFGEKTIGVAVGHGSTGLAQALANVKVIRQQPDWAHIGRLLGEWRPDALVLGLPLNMDGSENAMTQRTREFGKHLRDRYNLPIHMVDERLTTISAYQSLTDAGIPAKRHRQIKDKLAAQIILQSFLNESTGGGLGHDH